MLDPSLRRFAAARLVALVAALLLVVCVAGCAADSSETGRGVGGDSDAPADATEGDAALDDAGDDASEPDLVSVGDGSDDADDGVVSAPDAGEDGATCTSNGECNGDLCVQISPDTAEGFCSRFCSDRVDCPASWDCLLVRNLAVDLVRVCMPPDICIDRDGDGYGTGPGCRGPDCDDNDAGINGGAEEVCDGIDNDCDGNFDELTVDSNQDCDTGFDGVCSEGRTVCDGGLILCEPRRRASTEFCDGLDNDCDGAVDEGERAPTISEVCYSGPPLTDGIGQCRAGNRVCRDGRLTDCVGQVVPGFEVCDGIDNDCDGFVDEDDPGGGAVCDTGGDGVCAAGLTACRGGRVLCTVTTRPSAEVCDGRDNDCDGATDEDASGRPLRRACYSGPAETAGVGVCVGGVQSCESADFGRCEGQVTPSPIEICDGLDNDCDGEVDEGGPSAGLACSTGLVGVCAQGLTQCVEGEVVCEQSFEASDEICDGVDNDCDGDVDEDEDGEPLRRACYTGPEGSEGRGLCVGGEQVCRTGEFSSCEGQILPVPELCDGIDNDCDGVTDDGNPGAGISCTTGEPGVCSLGTTVCSAGRVVCEASREPEEERCDGLDNNCNGTIDEGATWSDLGTICTAGTGSCRTAGIRTCNPADPDGATICSATPGEPRSELCDGLDNDCDGRVDNGFSDLGAVCFVGTGACRSAGVRICDASAPSGDPICDATPGTPTDEICDGLDNDCDGTVDDGFTTGGIYDRDTACGSCFTDCTEIFDRPNGFGECQVSGRTASCRLSCNAGFFNLNRAPEDGCEFFLDPDAIYVSAGDDAASDAGGCGLGPSVTGGGRYPCASIAAGVNRAAATGRSKVFVASGAYDGSLTLREGIELFGGYSPITWERDPDVFITGIFGDDSSGHRRTIIAQNIRSATTTLDGFEVHGQAATGTSENSYAIWVRNSGRNLRISNNEIIAGTGGPGPRGTSGGDGGNGPGGTSGSGAMETGSQSCFESCSASGAFNRGGSGGTNVCGGTNVSGGNGGNGNCPDYDEGANTCSGCWSGSPRQTNNTGGATAPSGGAGGLGGCDGIIDSNCSGGCTCFLPAGVIGCSTGMEGGDGRNGANGSNGGAGAACRASSATVSGGHWSGPTAGAGGSGSPGRGGGGGGAGGGVETRFTGTCASNSGASDIGGSGGGGGAGGCGGNGGTGGGTGGGAFGLFVVFDSPPGGDVPVVLDNAFQRGFGGSGGDGGNGGGGGSGGNGGDGGGGGTLGTTTWCAGGGGKGGEGGDGGHGGGGGGGCGGASVGFYVHNAGGADLSTWRARNIYLGGGSGGAGGDGGGSGPGGSSGRNGDTGTTQDRNF